MRTGQGLAAQRGVRFVRSSRLYRAAALQKQQENRLDEHALRAQQATAQELADIAWDLAKLRNKSIEVGQKLPLRLLAKEASMRCNEFSARNLSCLVWSYAKLRLNDLLQPRTIFAEAAVKLNEFGPRDLCMCAWGMAKLSVQDAPFMDLLPKKALMSTSDFKLQDLCNLTWAIATLGIATPHLFRVVAQQSAIYVDKISPQDCANLAWAFAKVDMYDSTLFDVLVEAAISNLEHLETRHISNICWSFAKLQLHAWSLIRGIDSRAFKVMKEFKPQEISNLLWAAAVLHVSDAFFLHAAVKHATTVSLLLNAQELSNIFWSLASLSFSDNDVYLSFSEACVRKQREIGPQSLSNILWAYATVSADIPIFLKDCLQFAVAEMRKFKLQELSNLGWALAKLQAKDTNFFLLLAREVSARCSGFTLHNLSNVAWAFATVNVLAPILFTAIGGELSRRLKILDVRTASEIVLVGAATSIMGIVWALSLQGALDNDTTTAARVALTSIGQRFDQTPFKNVPSRRQQRQTQTCKAHAQGGSDARLLIAPETEMPTCVPQIVLDLADRLVIYKPPHWEVYPDVAAGEGPATQHQLSWHLQQIFAQDTWHIGHDAQHQHGFLHRLDVPSSGLILVAKTYAAFYVMQLQLNTGQLERDYVALCHGWLTSSRAEVNAPLLFWQQGGIGRGAAGQAGQSALTRLKVLAQASWHQERFSLVAIRIATGRRHQIRVHMSHIGHPIVCDGRYTGHVTFSSDQEWCSNNFLHRYRLAFRDSSGTMHQVMQPLQPELSAIISQLLPRDARSKEALTQWAQCPMYSWDECVPL